MTKTPLLSAWLFLAAILFFHVRAHAQPMGYERWTDSAAASGEFFDKSFAWVAGNLDNPLVIGMPAPGPNDTRLIDIEINTVENQLQVSGIWVENQDDFKQESWLIAGLTGADVKLLEDLQDITIVDIERYRRQGQTFFAAIGQRNRVKQPWVFLPAVTLDDIRVWQQGLGYRLVDVDYVSVDPNGREGPVVYYDAVMIRNAGSNFMLWGVDLKDESDVWDLNLAGFHVTDVEYVPALDQYICVYVNVNSLFDFVWDQTANQIQNYNSGKVIDLEGSHTGFKKWYKIHKY